jgi:hypothetical protein
MELTPAARVQCGRRGHPALHYNVQPVIDGMNAVARMGRS